jgi:hypothetical protein
VWSPAGGWWNNPAHWKRNTGFAAAAIGMIAFGLFKVSAAKERRPVAPSGRTVPSQMWCAYAPGEGV